MGSQASSLPITENDNILSENFENTSSRPSPVMECGVCSETYDDKEHRPVIFNCSHSFCIVCVMSLIQRNEKKCPLCRQEFEARSSNDLVINRDLLDLVNYVNNKEHIHYNGLPNDVWEMSEKKLSEMEEASGEISDVVQMNEKKIEELQNINVIVKGGIMSKLENSVMTNNTIIHRLQNHNEKLRNATRSLTESQKAIGEAKDRMKRAKNFSERGQIIDEVSCMIKSLQETQEQMTTDIILNRELQQVVHKECEETHGNISRIQDVLKDTSQLEREGDEKQDPFENLDAIAVRLSVRKYITVKDLKGTREQVYAVREINGGLRYAKVFLNNERNGCILHVHHLKYEPNICPTTPLIKYEDITEVSHYCDRLSFMDITLKGKTVRIIVKYYSEINFINHVKNHLLLCTGERGHSYANSKIFDVSGKGKPDEYLILGDYEQNNGSAGRAVVPKNEGSEWWRNGGSVGFLSTYLCQHGSTERTASQFRLLTKKCYASGIFAYVKDGLKDLNSLIDECENVREIKISDCGRIIYC